MSLLVALIDDLVFPWSSNLGFLLSGIYKRIECITKKTENLGHKSQQQQQQNTKYKQTNKNHNLNQIHEN